MKRWISFMLVLCLVITLPVGALAAKTPFIDDPERITDSANSVVMLYCYDKNGELIATGSGFACIEDGIIVTNYHVIEGASYFQAQTEGGMYFNIETDGMLAWDKDYDVAILKTKARTGMTLLPIGSAYNMLKGSKVIAIGSPQGFVNSVSSGLFSGIIRDGTFDYIQFDAAISHGSSGGALFNNDGEVIGITSSSWEGGNSLYFAVPIERATELWEKYQNGEYVATPIEEAVPANNEEMAPLLTVGEVLANPSEFDGKMVFLRGYVVAYRIDETTIELVDYTALDKIKAWREQNKDYNTSYAIYSFLEIRKNYCIKANLTETINPSAYKDGDCICICGIFDENGDSLVKSINSAHIINSTQIIEPSPTSITDAELEGEWRTSNGENFLRITDSTYYTNIPGISKKEFKFFTVKNTIYPTNERRGNRLNMHYKAMLELLDEGFSEKEIREGIMSYQYYTNGELVITLLSTGKEYILMKK